MISSNQQHVAVAVIRNQCNDYLLAQRHVDSHQGGLWEFPGGKVESGETVKQALVRELHEELNITAMSMRPLIKVPYDYSDKSVLLDVWLVNDYRGEPVGAEGQVISWVGADAMAGYKMPKANYAIVKACSLPDTYLITPEPGDSKVEWSNFLRCLEKSISGGIKLVQFRAKSLTHESYKQLAKSVVEICHNMQCRVLLNTMYNDELFSADGIHLSSYRLMEIREENLSRQKLISASCHNLEQVRHANKIGCDFIVLGPVKITASHPDTPPIGWDEFSHMSEESQIPVYALGGMTPKHLHDAWQNGAQGISAISSLWSSMEV